VIFSHERDPQSPCPARHAEAARTMGENGFGAVLVMEADALIGIRRSDTLRRVVAAGCDPATTPVLTS
jgi:CBS domain-containing protein